MGKVKEYTSHVVEYAKYTLVFTMMAGLIAGMGYSAWDMIRQANERGKVYEACLRAGDLNKDGRLSDSELELLLKQNK